MVMIVEARLSVGFWLALGFSSVHLYVQFQSHMNLKCLISRSENKDQHYWTFLRTPVDFNTFDHNFFP